MDVIAVVKQLKDLAADQANRVSIVKDSGCLPGLNLFLANDNAEVVLIALETLKFLSEEKENQPILYKDRDVVLNIKRVLENPSNSAQHKLLAAEIFRNITPAPETSTPEPTTTKKKSTRGGSRNTRNRPRTKKTATTGGFSSINSNSYTITLHLADILEYKKDVELGLLSCKGIISFTFDGEKSTVTVRATKDVTAAKLYDGIHDVNTLLKPQQVVRDETQETGVKHIDIDGISDKADVDADGYLDDNEEFENEKTCTASSLARLDDETSAGGGWFGGVGTYIAKSLYW